MITNVHDTLIEHPHHNNSSGLKSASFYGPAYIPSVRFASPIKISCYAPEKVAVGKFSYVEAEHTVRKSIQFATCTRNSNTVLNSKHCKI